MADRQEQAVCVAPDKQKQEDYEIHFGTVTASVVVELQTTMQIMQKQTELNTRYVA